MKVKKRNKEILKYMRNISNLNVSDIHEKLDFQDQEVTLFSIWVSKKVSRVINEKRTLYVPISLVFEIVGDTVHYSRYYLHEKDSIVEKITDLVGNNELYKFRSYLDKIGHQADKEAFINAKVKIK